MAMHPVTGEIYAHEHGPRGGDELKRNKNGQASNEADILIGALAGTYIHWLKIKDNKSVSSTRSMNGYARFRDIRQAPNGKIYAITETPN